MKVRIGIVVINFNGNSDTLACLNTIERYYLNENIKIYLIDNFSEVPISEEELIPFDLEVKYLKQKSNKGFAEGNNIGIREAIKNDCQFILLLNNDTEFIDNSLLQIIETMESYKDIGICGIVNYMYDNQDEIWQAGAYVDFRFGKIKHIEKFDPCSKSPVFVDYVPGSSFCINRKVINEIGLLDSDYFAYFEEMDFCIRAKYSGFKIAFLPSSKILHKVGQSSSNSKKFYLRMRNNLIFFRKYSSQWFILIYFKTIINTIKIIFKTKDDTIGHLKSSIFAFTDFHRKKFGKGHF